SPRADSAPGVAAIDDRGLVRPRRQPMADPAPCPAAASRLGDFDRWPSGADAFLRQDADQQLRRLRSDDTAAAAMGHDGRWLRAGDQWPRNPGAAGVDCAGAAGCVAVETEGWHGRRLAG